jgi:thiol-disulfide isomerase/thioredoxin
MSQPQEHYVSDKTAVYPIVQLDAAAVPDRFFAFEPPSTANLVKEFEHPTRTQSEALIIGKPAPDVSLTSLDGKSILLKSFQGKPVLLDFWATWCGPCIESMPSLKRLNSEAAKYGLILLSIDEDDDAKKAADFLSGNKESWLNFHDDGEIVRLFPNEGIPHFVLIDSSGRVVFSKSSFDEPAMRAAIAGLGPEFATITEISDP